MPLLPLDHPEPFAATLGVMLYPGEDEADRKKARAYTAHYLAEPLRIFHEAGGTLRYEGLLRIASDAGARLDDLERRWWEGSATGEIFKLFFALYCTDPGLASWENAIQLAERAAAREKKPGSRSALWSARREFLSVAHLWGAWCIRGRRFESHPEVGYDGVHDFEFFLKESEILRGWGQTWRPDRAKAEPPLPAEVWRVHDDWAPPPDREDCLRGKIPKLVLSDEQLAGLRKPGRPRSSR